MNLDLKKLPFTDCKLFPYFQLLGTTIDKYFPVKMWLLVKSVLVEMKGQHFFRFAKASNNNVIMNIVHQSARGTLWTVCVSCSTSKIKLFGCLIGLVTAGVEFWITIISLKQNVFGQQLNVHSSRRWVAFLKSGKSISLLFFPFSILSF